MLKLCIFMALIFIDISASAKIVLENSSVSDAEQQKRHQTLNNTYVSTPLWGTATVISEETKAKVDAHYAKKNDRRDGRLNCYVYLREDKTFSLGVYSVIKCTTGLEAGLEKILSYDKDGRYFSGGIINTYYKDRHDAALNACGF